MTTNIAPQERAGDFDLLSHSAQEPRDAGLSRAAGCATLLQHQAWEASSDGIHAGERPGVAGCNQHDLPQGGGVWPTIWCARGRTRSG